MVHDRFGIADAEQERTVFYFILRSFSHRTQNQFVIPLRQIRNLKTPVVFCRCRLQSLCQNRGFVIEDDFHFHGKSRTFLRGAGETEKQIQGFAVRGRIHFDPVELDGNL